MKDIEGGGAPALDRAIVPEFMRAIMGEQNYRDVETIVEKLCELELRGAITGEWHSHIIREIADELVAQQIANDVASEALTERGNRPDAPTTEAR